MTAADPIRDPLWCDPELREAYFDALAREVPPADDVADDESDLLFPPDLDAVAAKAYVDDLLAIEDTVRAARALAAEQDHLFHLTLCRAEEEPDAWVGPDPTLDPAWRDPRGRSAATVRTDRRDLAVRSAAADLGARVRLSDNQVRSRAYRAEVHTTRTPRLWEACRLGFVPEQSMSLAATLAASLPDDAPDAWATFDEAVHEIATTQAPGRFARRARAARERAHRESLTERHRRAASDREVTVEPGLDGMAYIGAVVPAAAARAIERRLDDLARHLAAASDEKRTLAQLRADAFVDLLTSAPVAGGAQIAATVHVTIPALALLGHSDEPAILDGYGPIDLDTAKRLAGEAKSWIRVLTHPVTGTVLDVERRTYRVPADLRRLLGVRYRTCIFPGCTRSADRCDMDHRQRWADGGTTSEDNLGPECPSHHPLKDETLWRLEQVADADGGNAADVAALRWISPTGAVFDVDPPPF
ncbi:MAG: DUF222 domain-containing protein [Microbacterium sp.]